MQLAEYIVSAYPDTADMYDGKQVDKEQFLRGIFKERREFETQRTSYVYDFDHEYRHLIAGIFGSPKTRTMTAGPDRGWKPVPAEDWETFVLIFDPREKGGQRLFVEAHSGTAQRSFARALESHINANSRAGWRVSIDPVFDRARLDDILRQFKGQVNRISLDFPKANLPTGIVNGLSNARKRIAQANARLKAEALSDHGAIDTDHEDMSSAIDLAERSGARVEVYTEQREKGRGKRRHVKRYDSENVKNVRTKIIEISAGISAAKEKAKEVIQSFI